MKQVKLGEFSRAAAAEAAKAITNIGDWKDTKEGEQYWKDCVASLRAMSVYGTSDGRPLPPEIPKRHREANADEHWRGDVIYYDTIGGMWIPRGPFAKGEAFREKVRYAVPVDVIPTDADCDKGRPVVMVRDNGTTWLPAKLLAVQSKEVTDYPFLVLIGGKYSSRISCRYPYAGELERYPAD